MEFSYPEEIKPIMAAHNNQICNDCGAQPTKWVSINNGVFLCPSCARLHNLLPKSISVVKSLEVDTFTLKELKAMQLGGNQRFQEFIARYQLPQSQSKDFKYCLKISKYYRDLLSYQANDAYAEYTALLKNEPTPEEGLVILDEIKDPERAAKEHDEVKKDIEGVFNKFGAALYAVGSAFGEKIHQMGIDTKLKEVSDKFTGKVNEFEENHPKVKEGKDKAIEAATKAGEFIVNGTKKIYNSETVQNLAQKADHEYLELKQRAKEYLDKQKEKSSTGEQTNTPSV